ncbi:MAG: sensor histidine kinase, partial [Rhizobiales bacterium]|nr:sensor histidine kinase [Hyphomicrobiales bacterium]
IDNALKYSPNNQSVEITAKEEHGSIRITVRDQGMGIPQGELGKIGRRFFRASNAKTMAGTGLGLYSAYKLLAYHGGTLRLLSNPEGGTTAVVTMPASSDISNALAPEGMVA